MQRLIDANALKEVIDCGHLRNPCEVCFSELDVVNLIDAQPTIDAEPHWIPMTERKPDFPKHSLWGDKRATPEYAKKYEPFEDKYLVCTDKGNIYVANWYANADGEPFWYGKCRGANIVAWMELPKPYEVEE